ncbi:MAG: acyltransferase domain-containing protein, partial [Caldilineaceae bacterium]|nr:acyltransferase domain-containing protein [Caldilineaceae bacterium]
QQRFARVGLTPIQPAQGVEVLAQLLQSELTQVGVLPVDWPLYLRSLSGKRTPSWLADLAETAASVSPRRRAPATQSQESTLTKLLAKVPQSKRQDALLQYLREQTGTVLALDTQTQIDAQKSLSEYGLDSLMSVELRNLLSQAVGQALPVPLLYDYPTLESLAAYLGREVLRLNNADEPESGDKPIAPVRQESANEAIAIVGAGLRFPGRANDLASFWSLLHNGVDAIVDIPADRWDMEAYYDPTPLTPGKMSTREGGFLENIDLFDPRFFGIAPREAVQMDPQQRLLLEVSWEALEHAGFAPDQLKGSQTGVFIGISGSDYARIAADDLRNLDAYMATGNTLSVAAGRLSYVLGLQGPNMAIDTACSSSLVAIHLACQSLRSGESNLALAGGVNLILSPEGNISFSQASNMMAGNDRCKTFDAAADGYVRGEGCGVVVLKRLSEAVADGDNVLAVIRGSAINQDGRSNGLTAPNGPAQEAVIRRALVNAGLEPQSISYVEAHGTGTPLGDPIEVQALAAVYGEGREPSAPLAIGSVKTNVGHLEAAAGIAGLLKVVLALQEQEIPPHLHFQQPNPYIPWAELPMRVAATRQAWPRNGAPRRAGVSSFGFSGTNAHVLLEEAPRRERVTATARPRQLLTLSARSVAALHSLAERYQQQLAAQQDRLDTGSDTAGFADFCFTANVGRAHFSQRLALVVESAEQAQSQLAAWLGGESVPDLHQGEATGSDLRPVFLFTGQGAQYVGMGRDLYAHSPVFRAVLDECDALLRPHLPHSLLSVLYGDDPALTALLDETAYTQPALFAVEYALAMLWQSWGIHPAAVMGHSVGEYVAACVAGVMSLGDGLTLITQRARLMQSLPKAGAMAVVYAGEARVRAQLAAYTQQVDVAALNGPNNIVISGERGAVEAVLAALGAEGVKAQRLNISHASHSPLMEAIEEEFEQEARQITFRAAQIPFVSNLTGHMLEADEIPDAAYWRRHLRHAVRFVDSIQAVYAQGYTHFIEMGPNPVLLGMARRCLPSNVGTWLPSLRQNRDDWPQILSSLGQLYVLGAAVEWQGFEHDNGPRRRLPLPTYPFQRERYWIEKSQPARHIQRLADRHSGQGSHPLLGQRLRSAVIRDVIFETQLHAAWPEFLGHHRVHGLAIMPASAYLEMILAGANAAFGQASIRIREVALHEALLLSEENARTVQLIFGLEPSKQGDGGLHVAPYGSNGTGKAKIGATPTGGDATVQILSLSDEGEWKVHLSGSVEMNPRQEPALDRNNGHKGFEPQGGQSFSVATLQAQGMEALSGESFYQQLSAAGLEFGESVQSIRQLWRREGEAIGELQLPQSQLPGLSTYQAHPALLDACFHLLGAPVQARDSQVTYVVSAIDTFRLHKPIVPHLWSRVIMLDQPERSAQGPKKVQVADIHLYDPAGELVAEIGGIHLQPVSREMLWRAAQHSAQYREGNWLYRLAWQPKPRQSGATETAPEGYLLAPDELATRLALQLDELSAQLDLAGQQARRHAVDRLCVAYIARAFQQLGWQPERAAHFSTTELSEQLNIAQRHRRLLHRLLSVLESADMLRQVEEEWEVGQAALPSPERELDALLAQSPAPGYEIELLERCGARLAEVLSGTYDPLHLLFPSGSTSVVEQIYEEGTGAQLFNKLVAQAIAEAVAQLPANRPVRVLEIGAGTGGTTSAVLPQLPPERTEYVFSDLSTLFLARAREKFSDKSFIAYQLLDIENDPADQGFANGQFDIILAANVLHATADLRLTLAHIKQLLAPHGMLILLEVTGPQSSVDLTFGLTEGWWKFVDTDLRPNYPVLDQAQWQALLEEEGFEAAVAIPGLDHPAAALLGQAVIMARGPEHDVNAGERTGDRTEGHRWLIFSGAGDAGNDLAELLHARGQSCQIVIPGDAYQALGADRWQIDPAAPEDYQRLLQDAQASAPLHGIVHLWGVDAACGDRMADSMMADSMSVADLERVQNLTCGSVIYLTQALHQASSDAPPKLWLVTRRGQALPTDVTKEAPGPAVAQTPLWGLGRVFALEQPEHWGGLIDLDPDQDSRQQAAALLAEIGQPDSEDQVAYREGERYVARLQHDDQLQPQPVTLHPDKAYLITGGLGRLGLKVARWMVEQGARHLVLTSRRGLPAREQWATLPTDSPAYQQAAEVLALEALGATLTIAAVDVSDEAGMAALFARFGNELPPLTGILHTPVVTSAHLLQSMPLSALQEAFRPKVMGAWVLHRLSRSMALDFFALFSSTTALLGSRYLGHYAAANQFLDGLAHYRQSLGLPAMSINWGLWEQAEQASQEIGQITALSGLEPMDADKALAYLGDYLGHRQLPQIIIAGVNWSVLKQVYEARRRRPLLEQVGRQTAAPVQAADSQARRAGGGREQAAALRQELQTTPAAQRDALLLRHLQVVAARVLGIQSPDRVAVADALGTLGLDSLMAMDLKNQLDASLGVNVAVADLLQGSTLSQIATTFLEQWSQESGDVDTQLPNVGAAPDANAEWEVIEL